MPTAHLTDIVVQRLKTPGTYFDDTTPAFGIRVGKNRKTWIVMRGQRRQRVRIGYYPDMPLAAARKEAKKLLSEEPSKAPRMTFGSAYELFKTHHVATRKARTQKDYRRIIEKHFLPILKSERLEEITHHRLAQITDALLERRSEHAHAVAVARTFFRWCVRRHYIRVSPLEGVQIAKSIPRERALDEPEIKAVWKAAGENGYPFGPFVQLAILLGQRRGEIAALRWEWIDEKARTIAFPREIMKGNRTHTIPYGNMTAGILDRIPRLNTTSLLFPARGNADAPLSGFSKFKKALDRKLAIPPFTIHDLRRSFASGWQRCGIRIDVTERYIAHRSGSFAGIVSVYQRHDLMPEMREAVARWETRLTDLLARG